MYKIYPIFKSMIKLIIFLSLINLNLCSNNLNLKESLLNKSDSINKLHDSDNVDYANSLISHALHHENGIYEISNSRVIRSYENLNSNSETDEDSNRMRNVFNGVELEFKKKKRRVINFGILSPGNSSTKRDDRLLSNVLAAIELATQKMRQPHGWLAQCDIEFEYEDTKCSSTDGALAAFSLYSQKSIDAFFGPICDYVLAPVARYASIWKIPVLSSGGLSQAFDHKNQYPTLTRMTGNYDAGKPIIEAFLHYNWTICAFMFHNFNFNNGKGHSDCHSRLSGMKQQLEKYNFTASFSRSFDETNSTYNEYIERLTELKMKARIVIMCADPSTIRNIMLAADELNMINGEYVFFNIEIYLSSKATEIQPWYNATDTQENNVRAKRAYTALFNVIAKQPEDSDYQVLSEEIKTLAKEKYNYTYEEDQIVSTSIMAFYDAVLLFAYAFNQSVKQLGENALNMPLNGTKLTHLMWNQTFTGITGNVTINANGDRMSDYSLLDLNPETGYFEIVANYLHDHGGLQFVEERQIHWPGGRFSAPPDRPICGFDNSLCPDNSLSFYGYLSIILGLVLIIMIIVSFLGYRHYKFEAEINCMSWRIVFTDVLRCNPHGNHNHRGSVHSMAKRGSQVTMYSDDLGSLPGDRQLFITLGFYKGCKVAIKPIIVNNLNLNRSLMLELKRMKDLQHEHLVRFYGACVDLPYPFILTEYCPKGSLQDILENEQIKLDWMFKLSLMHDIVRGMHFLHSSDINSHGDLKSSNCVVDSRFVLKITDFGLHQLRRKNDDEEGNRDSYAYWRKYLWTAPELLRINNPSLAGSQKGDVYSFGIIVHEIITRQGPFYLGEGCDKSPKEIVQLVRDKGKSEFRPKIEDDYEDVNNMMVKCWSEEPMDRPDFGYLKSTIRKINKENESGNILDNLLKRMEQYANNLESLVDERTQDYFEEKRKCEELLYQLLPKSVAAQLICGKSVVAETYDQVTIYFSDIVGFTQISAESSPMQVVNLLNDLYTCFDSVIENFDVYKVETIGDAYMVVSGLPNRNGTLHALEIARMALALLSVVYKFSIKHRPNEQLKLRIGLHSGPCVAGVVGLKMPRYCLFGDTVNTASRMESNGEALKIHMSDSTKLLLDKFGIFDIERRGLIPMKGKGEMLTYWLKGETLENKNNNNNKPLFSIDGQDPTQIDKVNGDSTLNHLINTNSNNPSNNINNNNISNSNNNNSVVPKNNQQTGKKINFVKPTQITNNNNINGKNLNRKTSLGEDCIRNLSQPLLAKMN